MYPARVFSLFPPFPRENKVFVIMSFAPRFNQRWENVIAPAIRRVVVDSVRLEPVRADTRTVSDSILTEIITNIANCRLIIADVTTIGEIDGGPVRNGNVMYEVGLAQAVRQPEEVLLFRSDHDRLIFDIANVRVNDYSPDTDAESATDKVADLISEAMKEISIAKSLSVQQAAQSLDYPSMMLLAQNQDFIPHPIIRDMREVMAHIPYIGSIPRLLELGIAMTEYKVPVDKNPPSNAPMEQYIHYRVTPFGQAVRNICLNKLGFIKPRPTVVIHSVSGRNSGTGIHPISGVAATTINSASSTGRDEGNQQ